MIYTITTRTRKRGIYFEPHELRPLGIGERSYCWGIWVEGRYWDKRVRLDIIKEQPWTDQQSPHLMVSPLHPDAWPRAFTIQVLLERRRFLQLQHACQFDSLLGITDALARFGVNVLFAQTAQVGYDLISFMATCELPRLRPEAQRLLGKADDIGRWLIDERARIEAKPVSKEQMASELRAAEDKANHERAIAFQTLGRRMMPRLAELEARLLLVEHLRYRWSEHPVDREQLLNITNDAPLFELVVGKPRAEYAEGQPRTNALVDSLSAPWFCNSKVIEAGENPFYLSYQEVRERETRRVGRQRTGAGGSQISGPGELSVEALSALYEHAFTVLKERPLNPPLDTVVPPSVLETEPTGEPRPRSGTAERVGSVKPDTDYEDYAVQGFFRRQGLMPLRIASLPSLAYARFWAFGGAKGDERPIRLKYEKNVLGPVGSETSDTASMSRLFLFLNNVTKPRDGDPKGRYDAQSAVFANINLRDQFLRLRFTRERVEETSYLTLRMEYHIHRKGAEAVNSQGLLREIIRAVLEDGFRVERAEYRILDSTIAEVETSDSKETGRVELTLKAVTQEAYRLCERLVDDETRAIAGDLGLTWEEKAQSRLHGVPGLTIRRPGIEIGFTPQDR